MVFFIIAQKINIVKRFYGSVQNLFCHNKNSFNRNSFDWLLKSSEESEAFGVPPSRGVVKVEVLKL